MAGVRAVRGGNPCRFARVAQYREEAKEPIRLENTPQKHNKGRNKLYLLVRGCHNRLIECGDGLAIDISELQALEVFAVIGTHFLVSKIPANNVSATKPVVEAVPEPVVAEAPVAVEEHYSMATLSQGDHHSDLYGPFGGYAASLYRSLAGDYSCQI
jgi:hypothetical protein